MGKLRVIACLVVAACSSKSPEMTAGDAAAGTGDAATSSGHDASSVLPAGWLYTQGNGIYEADGQGSGTRWVGRGVNMDDIFLCGYNNTLYMTTPDQTVESMVSGLMSGWKPTFVRISLGMASYTSTVSWLSNAAQYATPMTNVIDAIAANPNVHVLVTLRSDASMIGQDTTDGDAEATGLPSDSTSTPNASTFPAGTDPVYAALVDTFGSSGAVLFGITNEPGGNKLSDATISAAMSHAVGAIRAEEDKLGVPHHVVSVQGNGWTSSIGFYDTAPLPYDNVVYEVHGYPPATDSYTYDHIPVILGEYGDIASGSANAFYADLETKQIPNLAWDFESYSDCAPDLLNVNQSGSDLEPSAWGMIVQAYLLAHAQ
jgi:Cellulase (glycosyl hydrolase family 5)